LSAGIGEIIELAMAKNRDERYRGTEEMLEDLRLVRAGGAPVHARRNVNMDHIAEIETTAQTVDIDPSPVSHPLLWGHPLVIGLLVWSALSSLVIVVMLVKLLTH
jgi:hypothetical protein